MATWIKIGAAVFAAVAIFFGGYRYAAALYQSDIDQLKAEHAMALAAKEREYRANQSKQISAYAEAIDQLEKKGAELSESRADSGSLRIELERVRNLADRYRAELSRAGADSCKHFAIRLGRCVGLLEEGASLSSEGAGLSQKLSGKHDAVVKIHEAQ